MTEKKTNTMILADRYFNDMLMSYFQKTSYIGVPCT